MGSSNPKLDDLRHCEIWRKECHLVRMEMTAKRAWRGKWYKRVNIGLWYTPLGDSQSRSALGKKERV